jgi:hypothetical protein
MIYGPKDDGAYVVEFGTAEGDVLAISYPRSEAAVIGGDVATFNRVDWVKVSMCASSLARSC